MKAGQGGTKRPSAPYLETLAWLYGTQRFGIKLGLENAQRLFKELGVSKPGYRVLHVAGTNGKGSVCAMIDSICRAQGYRSGLYTSPHLISFRERIQVNGEIISEQDVVDGLRKIRTLTSAWNPHPTFFEITTALALLHFRKANCEVVAFETGLGGRLDATNAITPTVSVLTPIDYDHQAWLGSTIAEIAAEKAGIIKHKLPVVSETQMPEAEAVIRRHAREHEAPLTFVTDSCDATNVGLAGMHQKSNASLAIAALYAAEISVTDAAVTKGLATVSWPARFERWDEQVIIDGAHNPAGARVLAETWRQTFGDTRATIILGVLSDKDVAAIWQPLAPIADRLLLPAFRSERARPPGQLHDTIGALSPALPAETYPSLESALANARKSTNPVLVTGSLHFAGEALSILRGHPEELEECAQ